MAEKTDVNENLIAHWELKGSCRDETGAFHGENHGVTFERDSGTGVEAGVFDGTDSFITVSDDPKLNFGKGPFSISAWIKAEEDITNSPGNILQKYDPANRRGVNFSIPGCSPGYCGQSDIRNLHFGVDQNRAGPWIDCGRPWEGNPIISSMAVYKGEFFVSTVDAINPKDACKVFRYAGGKGWVDCGRVGDDMRTYTVKSMVVHKGKLFAVVGKYWAGARSRRDATPPTRVYWYDGDNNWVAAGEIENGINVRSFASFQGEIYATTSVLNTKVYKTKDGQKWEACSEPLPDGPCAIQAYQGNLYVAGNGGTFYRYEGGSSWKCIGEYPYDSNQTHCLNVYQGRLYAGTWPYGHVLRYEADNEWTDCGRMGVGLEKPALDEIMDLTVYNGKMYGTAIPKAEVYRYDDDKRWTMLARFGMNEGYSEYQFDSWRRVTCMAVYAGRLFAGTGICGCDDIAVNDLNLEENTGRVFCMEAGHNVTYDDDIGSGWTHIAAVRSSNAMTLYVNGAMVSTRPALVTNHCDVSNDKPLMIGFGEQNYFQGKMRDIMLYRDALSMAQIEKLSNDS